MTVATVLSYATPKLVGVAVTIAAVVIGRCLWNGRTVAKSAITHDSVAAAISALKPVGDRKEKTSAEVEADKEYTTTGDRTINVTYVFPTEASTANFLAMERKRQVSSRDPITAMKVKLVFQNVSSLPNIEQQHHLVELFPSGADIQLQRPSGEIGDWAWRCPTAVTQVAS
jgi:hypothetical protein